MLNAKETADAVGVSFPTIYRWVREGLPHYKVPRGITMVLRFDLDEVEAWIEKQRKGEVV